MSYPHYNERSQRVRYVHGLGRPRFSRPSFRDSEARRGSQAGCCEESKPTWAKAEAETRFPRFSRRSLVTRFSDLPCYFRIGQPFADHLGYCQVKAVCIGHGIVLESASGNHPTTASRVHESRRTADEGFVCLDLGARAAEFGDGLNLERQPQTMHHEPCGLLSDASGAVNFPRANTVLAVSHHPHCGKPLIETDGAILEDGSNLHRELAFRMASLALPDAASGNIAHVRTATGGAGDSIAPASGHKVRDAIIGLGEVLHRLHECFGFVRFVFHAPRLQGNL